MLVVVLVLIESECFTIGLTEQNNCRTNGGLCRHRTPMHRRRGRARFPNFGIWVKALVERQRIGKYPQITQIAQILFQILCAPSWPPNIREARA